MFADLPIEPRLSNNFVGGGTGKTCETIESKPHEYWKTELLIAQEDWISTEHRGNTSNEREFADSDVRLQPCGILLLLT